MVFISLGYFFHEAGLLPQDGAEAALHIVAEIALIILLFLDAAQIDLTALRKSSIWPARMLLMGLPLALGFGTIAAWLLLPGWPLAALALVAALLAPTDAALGQAVVSNPLVPERVRRTLTVESGLNDGMALPAVLLFASLTASAMGQEDRNWLLFGTLQLVLGPIVGIIAGYLGGKLLMYSQRKGLTSQTFEGIGALALAGVAYLAAGEVGGNGFIASFVAGLTFGNILKGQCKFVFEFTESEGQLLIWAAFFLLGLALVPEVISELTWPIFALIIASLFIVRPLAIWISLIGTGAAATTRLFLGWFGPRGLATALFALLVLPQINHEYAEIILVISINAVWISALLHGLSAAPGAKFYSKLIANKEHHEETQPMPKAFE
jgi:NhaP-type Na+/H+ or K+/H+ antiporter